MFRGEYNHTVDTKGRLIVPSKFRELLGDEFVVTKGLDGCLFVYSTEEWEIIEAKFREVSQFSQKARKFARFFFAGATNCEIDKQGRVLLPAVLREFAGIEKEVVLAGVLNHIEIWNREKWQETSEYDDVEEIAEDMASLGLTI
ncbi:MAG: division/cell wall cluster transcriptional repressor MraZ [Lachnospiraceae bacterium]|nr:division/cell wall cluster transcriptional repressor MraZ [Lachnospiraceae bacterium]